MLPLPRNCWNHQANSQGMFWERQCQYLGSSENPVSALSFAPPLLFDLLVLRRGLASHVSGKIDRKTMPNECSTRPALLVTLQSEAPLAALFLQEVKNSRFRPSQAKFRTVVRMTEIFLPPLKIPVRNFSSKAAFRPLFTSRLFLEKRDTLVPRSFRGTCSVRPF